MTPTTESAGQGDGVRIVRLSGPLTYPKLPQVQKVLREHPSHATIIDLSDVPYADSAALGTLVAFHVSCERDGRKYALTGLGTRVLRILEVCHIDKVLTTFETVEQAQEAFSSVDS